MSHPVPLSFPDSAYTALETAAKAKGICVRDYIKDCAMVAATGKNMSQFLEYMKKAQITRSEGSIIVGGTHIP